MKSVDEIVKDLKDAVQGEVLSDEVNRFLYTYDACIFRMRPLLIVLPKSKEDVIKVVTYANREGIPLTARGGGSGRAGQGIGPGIILDFSRYMNNLLEINTEENFIIAQPGITHTETNAILKKYNKMLGPDPSSGDMATVGGMVANNSSGPHCPKYGPMKEHVLSLEVVLVNGDVIRTKKMSKESDEYKALVQRDDLESRIYQKVTSLLEENKNLIEEKRPYVTKNCSGYNLWDTVSNGYRDLTQLIVGSEGTLGVVTEAKLRIVDIPKHTSSALLIFDSYKNIGRAVWETLQMGTSMAEIMERNLLEITRSNDPALDKFLPKNIEAGVLIEFDGDSVDEIEGKMKKVEEKIVEELGYAREITFAKNPEDKAKLVKIRKAAASILNKIEGPKKPVAFIEDGAVHPSRLSEYISGLQEIFKKYEVDANIYGHAGDGNLHVNPILNLKEPKDIEKMKNISREVLELVLSLQGTISGEHGDGISRAYFVQKQFGELYSVLKEIKELFDPNGILNPDKVLTEDEDILTKYLRYGADYRWKDTKSFFDKEEVRREIEKCHGCGTCRSYCPIYLELKDEKSTSRAKSNILRGIISGELDINKLTSKQIKDIMDHCINCKQCLTKCPTGVNVPLLCQMARTYYVEKKGQTLQNIVLGNSELLAKMGSLTAPLSNEILKLYPLRRIMEMTVGIDKRRRFPEFQRNTFQKTLKQQRARGEKKVAYFTGCFARFNDPEGTGSAVLKVMEKNGCEVIVPEIKCCGVAKISSGSGKAQKQSARYNVNNLLSLIKKGYPVISSCSSCTLALQIEYPELLESKEAVEVAENTFDIHVFLYSLHKEGKLNIDFGEMPMSVAYHNPCHLEAQGITKEPVELIKLVPGVKVKEINDSCCGIAGTFGMKSKNFDLSMMIGKKLFDEIKKAGVEKVITSCGACKMQIEQGTGLDIIHPLHILKKAYEKADAKKKRPVASE